MDSIYILLFLLAIVAFLYSSVGHGGASGYLAVMAIMGVAPAMMKSSAIGNELGGIAIFIYRFLQSWTF